ncbi:TPA: hypothetical protein HA244_04540 [Candidatus Micrarchaeota archaeon]|nr:hypothetical protein [Candidatus Micrarchaeota archaeon]
MVLKSFATVVFLFLPLLLSGCLTQQPQQQPFATPTAVPNASMMQVLPLQPSVQNPSQPPLLEPAEKKRIAEQIVGEQRQAQGKGYKTVSEKPKGWFANGQDADVVLYATGFGESGGAGVLNHPSKVATDGKRLVVSDTRNHRVLVWNSIPARSGQPADLVLGQPDFNSNTPGLGASKMNWPVGVATDGRRLIVADAYNDRVLVWNDFPTRNGQPADIVLGAPDFGTWPNYLDETQERDPARRIYWPWDVYTDGQKLFVTSTTDGSVLVWNSFPVSNNQPADLVLGAENFSARFSGQPKDGELDLQTPRSIAFDGTRLAVGDYNAHALFVWSRMPSQNGVPPDIAIHPKRQPEEPPSGAMGLAFSGGRLFATVIHFVFAWNSFPTKSGQKEDYKVGMQRTREETLLAPDAVKLLPDAFNSPFGVATDGRRFFVADSNNNRVLLWNEIPASAGAKPDVVLGAPDFETNVFVSRNSFTNPQPFSDGEMLFVGSDGFGGFVYKKIPDESKAAADVVVGTRFGDAPFGGQAVSDGKRLYMVFREGSKVLVWNNIPEKDDVMPDVILGASPVSEIWGQKGKGKTAFDSPASVASDGKRLFVSDQGNNRILAWNAIPPQNQTPADLVLGQPDFESTSPGQGLNQLDRPSQISTDGIRLAVADQSNNRILVWKTIPARSGQPADFEIKIVGHSAPIGWAGVPQFARLAGPQGVFVYNNSLFVSDMGNNRVLVWTKFPESEADEPDVVLGQKDFKSNYPASMSKNGLLMPGFLSFDGSFLWVGEFKWSDRLLRYSVG